MSSDPKVVNFADARGQRRGLLDDGSAEPFASFAAASALPSTGALSLPATTLSSTMAFTGRTNMTISPDDWRKPQRRKVYAALDARFPQGLPIEFQIKDIAAEVIDWCLEQGWPEPKAKTVHRAIRDRYFASTFGST